MKNVIHKTKGYIYKIDKISRSEERLHYTYFDNGIEYANGISRDSGTEKLDKTIVSDIGYNYNNFMDYISEQSLLLLKSGSELATQGNQCWVFNKGVGNVNNTVRVSIPLELIGKYLFTGNDIDTLIASYRTNYASYTNRCKYTIVIYFISIPAPDLAILQAYANEGVLIENKS